MSWPYRGGDVAAQATNGAVRYDITYKPAHDRWYIDASWASSRPGGGHPRPAPLWLGRLCRPQRRAPGGVGPGPLRQPTGAANNYPVGLAGLSATTRDGHLRAAISEILAMAETHHAGAVVIEDLDFVEQRTEGREHAKEPAFERQTRESLPAKISGLPTAQFRDRLTQMADNAGVAVIAVGPAYTSLWGAQHWLAPLQRQYPRSCLTGHHAAAVAMGRRGLAQRAGDGGRTLDAHQAMGHEPLCATPPEGP